jgi:hypothetical protein
MVSSYQNTRYLNPEDRNMNIHCHKNCQIHIDTYFPCELYVPPSSSVSQTVKVRGLSHCDGPYSNCGGFLLRKTKDQTS